MRLGIIKASFASALDFRYICTANEMMWQKFIVFSGLWSCRMDVAIGRPICRMNDY